MLVPVPVPVPVPVLVLRQVPVLMQVQVLVLVLVLVLMQVLMLMLMQVLMLMLVGGARRSQSQRTGGGCSSGSAQITASSATPACFSNPSLLHARTHGS